MSFLMFSNTGSRYARVFPDPVSAAIMYYKHRGEKDARVERKDGGFITNFTRRYCIHWEALEGQFSNEYNIVE